VTLSPEFLREVAREYNAHVTAGWSPVRAVAVSRQVPYNTAKCWIRKARRSGLHLESGHGLLCDHPAWARKGEQ